MFTAKQVEKAGRNHMRVAVAHGMASNYHKKKAAELGPKHPDYNAHKDHAEQHMDKMTGHLEAGESLVKHAGRKDWTRKHSAKVMKDEMSKINNHPEGPDEGAADRHYDVTHRIPEGLHLHNLHNNKPIYDITAAELSKPFAHEHQVLSHVHHILADHHEALANKAQRKQAPLSPPSHDFLRHSSVAEKHRAAGLHHAAKAGDRPNHEEMRNVIEQHVEHHPIHGMKRPEKAHELLRHFTKKIGGHSAHAAVAKKPVSPAKQNEAKAKHHYMLAHAHQRLARTETYRGNVKESLNHRDRAQRHIAKGNTFLPEHKREAHFAKALGSVRHAIGRKNFDYAGPVRDFIVKHDK